MATKVQASSYESEGEDQEQPVGSDQDEEDDAEEDDKSPNNNVSDILKRLHSTGALFKKPKQEYRCYSCEEDFRNWLDLERHLIRHVSMPVVLLDRLPSDDEDAMPSGDDWSDEEDAQPQDKPTPQKIDISQILKRGGISLKLPGDNQPTANNTNSSDSALNKLSGLGFTIKKNSTVVKQEKPDEKPSQDVLSKLDKLGGIKLKLKSDGGGANSFKVVNGLKDFTASDDDDMSGNEAEPEGDFDDEPEKSGGEHDSGEEDTVVNSRKNSESDDSGKGSLVGKKIGSTPIKNVQNLVTPKVEGQSPVKLTIPSAAVVKPGAAKPGRPAVKQTPKRGANLPIGVRSDTQQLRDSPGPATLSPASSTPERRESQDSGAENITVKQEVVSNDAQQQSAPLFSGQIKTERSSPPPSTDSVSTPILANVKKEPETVSTAAEAPSQSVPSSTTNLLPVTKKENTGVTIIEINGDSNDEDDDCCVVSATPAPDIKPKIETTPALPYAPPPVTFAPTPSTFSSSPILTSRTPTTPSTEKQHSFNWNAPDTKPPIDTLEKSADDMFESLLSSGSKSGASVSEISEYVSLDSLGPKHTCEVCNTRFTSLLTLEDHKRSTGHSSSLVAPSSSTLLPYNPNPGGSILSSLLPVKHIAEQVGKLSTIGSSGPGFTHQQNVMINIQAYPGSGGVMPPPQYNPYQPGQNMHPGFQQQPNNMYGPAGQMGGQYPGQSYMGQAQTYDQYGNPISNPPPYPNSMPPNSFGAPPTNVPYSTASPMQNMQQAYGQGGSMLPPQQPMGQMGPPNASPNHQYPASSPGSMKPPTSTAGSGIRIQNVQTFLPGQTAVPAPGAMPGQSMQMPPPGQIRMATAATASGPRARMPGTRGPRPTIRPGMQVHGQVRGAKPGSTRMPIKRPAGMGIGGPGMKRRPDMLLPGRHDNEDCQVMAMQKQREGMPMIHSVQGAKDKLNIGSGISITKKPVNKAAAMANVLASRGISIKQKQKSRSPSPERPLPHIPNLGAGMSIKHTSKSSSFSIPEAKVGGGSTMCKLCSKMCPNQNALAIHMANVHPQSKIPLFKCDECPASYPKSLQLQHHKRVFHNVMGPNRELGLPVVDLSQEENLQKLSSLGIYSFIPLANREQASGCFGIPVISVHNMNNGLTSSLQALGADGLLSLGPLKPLPKT